MSTTYDFDTLAQRKGTLSAKWNEDDIESFCGNRKATPFWVADMDFKSCPAIIDEATKIAQSGSYGYPAFKNLKEDFQAFVLKRHGLSVDTDEISISQGVLSSIAIVMSLVTAPGDGVIVPFPAYKPFVSITERQERKLLPWYMKQEGTAFSLDWDSYETLCRQAKLLILCSPHNPTGVVFTEQELEKACMIAKKHGVFIICDEIHIDLTFPSEKQVPFLEIARKMQASAMSAMAPSKTFNIAGEHFSIALFSDPQVKARYDAFCRNYWLQGTSYFSTALASAAYRNGYEWLMEATDYLEGNARFIEQFCKSSMPLVKPLHAGSSFICLWDCTALLPYVEQDAQNHPDFYARSKTSQAGLLSTFFGKKAGIAMHDGTWFGGERYKGYVRFNYGTRRSEVARALTQCKKAVDELTVSL
ncbi:MAG: aminotransferase class I/II-fold pyridoxal phosphate-dependent enzyme [Spirochaetia bacterium]|nr:aminotransferase class I/II-fold pyridoxal phosphate-dependent enzyme [Spirochaetia bacterium]